LFLLSVVTMLDLSMK